MSVAIGQVSSSVPDLPSQPSPTILPSPKLPSTATAIAHDTNQTLDNADEGAILREVLADTPASQAGLRPVTALSTSMTSHPHGSRLNRSARSHPGPYHDPAWRCSRPWSTAAADFGVTPHGQPAGDSRLAGTDSPPAASPPSSLTGISSVQSTSYQLPDSYPPLNNQNLSFRCTPRHAPYYAARRIALTLPAQLSNNSRN